MKAWLLFLFFLGLSQPTAPFPMANFIVWNIGQGSWSTFLDEGTCVHFDMGGEKFTPLEVTRMCRNKKNFVLLSHDDWDHINLLKRFSREVKNLCVYYPKASRHGFLKKIPACLELPKQVTLVSTGSTRGDRNASSLVYLLLGQVLVTGDAPMSEEKKWLALLPHSVPILLLGHHGSRTSTSEALLKKIKPRMAIASARKSKYGHPHPLVMAKLKKQRVPMLRTETLGSIGIQLKIKSFESKAYTPSPNPSQPLRKSQFRRKH